jgi:hypothetical protein
MLITTHTGDKQVVTCTTILCLNLAEALQLYSVPLSLQVLEEQLAGDLACPSPSAMCSHMGYHAGHWIRCCYTVGQANMDFIIL